MLSPKVYADFQNLDDSNRLRLTFAGTVADLTQQGIQLCPGLVLTFSTDDGDDAGRADELRVEGIVAYNADEQCWVAAVDWAALRQASDDVLGSSHGVPEL